MRCSKCQAPATVVRGVTVLTCQCRAPVVADAKATMRGSGGLKP